MIRVLIVDDDEEWRTLVTDSLPEYRVDSAEAYQEARHLLSQGIPYDVAIVDLNLVKSRSERLVIDRLGKNLLAHLRDEYPSTPRIALTGAPPGAVRGLIETYGLTELLLKQSMNLSELGEAVERALENVASELSLELRWARGDLWDDFSRLRDSVNRRLGPKAKTRGNDLNVARAAGAGYVAADALEAAKAGQVAFESDCSAVTIMIAKAHDQADLEAAARELAALRDKYEGAR